VGLRRRALELLATAYKRLLTLVHHADPTFTLNDENVRWLRENLLGGTVTPWDLATTYTFSHHLIGSRALVDQTIDPSETGAFRWKVRFFNDREKKVQLSVDPISRSIVLDYELCASEGTGVVAHNDHFRLTSFRQPDGNWKDTKRNGIGGEVYRREYQLYRLWGAKEIHMTAIEDGRVVWPRMGFVPQDPEMFQRMYRAWAKKNGVLDPLPASPKLYPEAFLRSETFLLLYKEVR
jgi:hypothetical protein